MGATRASIMVASKTARVPILAAREGGQAEVFELEMESREGTGRLYLDAALTLDAKALGALRSAFCVLGADRDVLVRLVGDGERCVCGPSLGLPVFLGMRAAVEGLPVDPAAFATGTLAGDGKIEPVGGLAEKIRAVLSRGRRLLVPAGQSLPIQGLEVVEVADVEEATRLFFGQEGRSR